jgi:hypothetical protein
MSHNNDPYVVYDNNGIELYSGPDIEEAKKIARDSDWPWVYHNGGRRKVHFGEGETITLGKEVVIL